MRRGGHPHDQHMYTPHSKPTPSPSLWGNMAGAGRRRRGKSKPTASVADGVNQKVVQKPTPPRCLSQPHDLSWSPPFRTIFMVLLSIRVWAAMVSPISDCDEVFNYWEPTHYLLFGRGLQTWEYSPEFALRSYAYVGGHAMIGKLVALLSFGPLDKVAIFFGMRAFLSMFSAFSEATLYEALARRVGNLHAIVAGVFLTLSPGMFHSAPAFLPSSFAMYCVMWATTFWLQDDVRGTMLSGCLAVLLGWPFAGLVFVPLGLHMMFTSKLGRVALWGVVWSSIVVGVSVLVDHKYYQTWVVAVWNIVKYNALGGGGGNGSELYGVEPPTFYVKNLFLNFNVVFLFSLFSVVALLPMKWACRLSRGRLVALVSPFWIWFGFMTSQPHKEERFMFVVYPIICVAAAVSVCQARVWLRMLEQKVLGIRREYVFRPSNMFVYAIVAACLILSWARIMALFVHYSAPLRVYQQFSSQFASALSTGSPALLCVAKEWYRFPSTFFLPESPRVDLGFLKSDFSGQLPQQYAAVNGTSVIQAGFNDLNREDPTRYVTLDMCDFVVDLKLRDQKEAAFDTLDEFEVVFSAPFLDAANSPTLTRAFFIPVANRNVFGEYQLLRREAVRKAPRQRRQRPLDEDEA